MWVDLLYVMDKKALFFKDMPEGYRKMKNFVCRVDFSGIQGFIIRMTVWKALMKSIRRSEYIQQLSVKINEELTGI